MNCYVHPDKEAVGACIGCGKFICSECATEIQGKLYCKRCVEEFAVQQAQELNEAYQWAEWQRQQPPTNVYMNGGGPYGHIVPPYPTNSFFLHLLLLFFTAGIGNVIYFLYVKSRQARWNELYRYR